MAQRVLIVDDAVPLHKLISNHLAEESLELHSAFDGETALAMVYSVKPDLVLLDVDLPGINGFEVCRQLKEEKETCGIPVVFLTAAASSEAKVCGFELQATDYITKPFDPSELRVRVRAALRNKLLLDLVPKRLGAIGEVSRPPAPGTRRLNARVTVGELLMARSANPWNRVAPV